MIMHVFTLICHNISCITASQPTLHRALKLFVVTFAAKRIDSIRVNSTPHRSTRIMAKHLLGYCKSIQYNFFFGLSSCFPLVYMIRISIRRSIIQLYTSNSRFPFIVNAIIGIPWGKHSSRRIIILVIVYLLPTNIFANPTLSARSHQSNSFRCTFTIQSEICTVNDRVSAVLITGKWPRQCAL